MPRKSAKTLPYKILPFSGDIKLTSKCSPIARHEFFRIEALLRSEPVMSAYMHGGEQALHRSLRDFGIIGHQPLRGTHHALLNSDNHQSPVPPGYLDRKLGIIDLGVLAKLPPNSAVHSEGMTIYGPQDGEAECLSYLREENSRFLCLLLDVSHPPTAIKDRLFEILKDRHAAYAAALKPERISLYQRIQRANHFKEVKAWLHAFQCYDLYEYRQISYGRIAAHIWKDHKRRDAAEKAYSKVDKLIRSVGSDHWPPLPK